MPKGASAELDGTGLTFCKAANANSQVALVLLPEFEESFPTPIEAAWHGTGSFKCCSLFETLFSCCAFAALSRHYSLAVQ